MERVDTRQSLIQLKLTFSPSTPTPLSLPLSPSVCVTLSPSLSLSHTITACSLSFYPYYLTDCGYCSELKLSQKSKQNIHVSTILPFLKAPPTKIYCTYVLVVIVCTSRINIPSHYLSSSLSLSFSLTEVFASSCFEGGIVPEG